MRTDMMRTLKNTLPIGSLTENLPSTEDVLHSIGLQYERNSMTALSTVAAFAIGALVGAAFTALYAPRPGRELRQDLNERVRAWGERVGWSDRRAGDDEAAAH